MPSLVLDKNTSEVLNVNADTIATELAINLSASKLIFISDVPFIKDTQGERISSVDENVARKLFDQKIIYNGMIVKVENSLKALNQGVQKIHIISGEIKNALINELETEEGIGTVFQKQSLDYWNYNDWVIIFIAFFISSLETIKGGVRRIMFPCIRVEIRPFFDIFS